MEEVMQRANQEWHDMYVMLKSESENYQAAAEALWQMLDNVDTLGDVYKPELNSYFLAVSTEIGKRFDYIDSDGHKLIWPAMEQSK